MNSSLCLETTMILVFKKKKNKESFNSLFLPIDQFSLILLLALDHFFFVDT